jgi:putative PIN family toxin of toxin-antitoxin system
LPGSGNLVEAIILDRQVRIVFDTNVVLSALVFGRRLAWLRASWARGDVTPIVCRETTTELLRVIAYPKFKLSPAERETLLGDYLPFAEVVQLPDPAPALPVACRDRDDMVFIQLAVVARADLLVSGDADLTTLREVAPVAIAAAIDLQRLLENG